MGNENRLSDAEYAIMRWFWKKGPMTSKELAALVADKNWKPTTLLTFLARLAEKGMLAAEKQGKANLYRPLIGKNDYKKAQGSAFLEEQYGGSAKAFLAAMVDARGLSREELQELQAWLKEKEAELHD